MHSAAGNSPVTWSMMGSCEQLPVAGGAEMTQSTQVAQQELERGFENPADERLARILETAFEKAIDRDRRHHRHSSTPAKSGDGYGKFIPLFTLIVGGLGSYYGAQSAMRDRIDQSVKELRSELKDVRSELRDTFVSKDSIQELKSLSTGTGNDLRELRTQFAAIREDLTVIKVGYTKRNTP
ncbi:MAG TPA: hypothetical protein VK540_29785 [Polyangiaceae bacterium]|nr:hypothetical protein [Polyangiaceae bacterium]